MGREGRCWRSGTNKGSLHCWRMIKLKGLLTLLEEWHQGGFLTLLEDSQTEGASHVAEGVAPGQGLLNFAELPCRLTI
eukprot:scaffold39051_cov15-Tisochrysis_lutea.AAC.4